MNYRVEVSERGRVVDGVEEGVGMGGRVREREKATRQHESARETELVGLRERMRGNDGVMQKSGTKDE